MLPSLFVSLKNVSNNPTKVFLDDGVSTMLSYLSGSSNPFLTFFCCVNFFIKQALTSFDVVGNIDAPGLAIFESTIDVNRPRDVLLLLSNELCDATQPPEINAVWPYVRWRSILELVPKIARGVSPWLRVNAF